MADDRTHRQIIDDALAGTPGDLHIQFRSTNKVDRIGEINEIIRGYGLDG